MTVLLSLAGGVVGLATDPGEILPGPAPEPPAERKAEGFFAVSPQTDLDATDYGRMKNGGVDIVRLPMSWNAVQNEPGDCQAEPNVDVCNWTHYDSVVGQAAARGLRVLPTLGGRPEFAADKNSHKFIREHPPTSGEALRLWRGFVRAAAARYGHGGTFWSAFETTTGLEPVPIVEWQVWNEPNAAAYWPPRPRPRQYAKLVKNTATAIREADPNAEIVLGGMFGTATVSSRKYLRKLYAVDGIEDHFDSIAIHPYSAKLRGLKVQVRWVRKVAKASGDPGVGLWATELGWGSGKGGHPLQQGHKRQAKLLKRSFRLFRRKRAAWNVEGVTWFTWRDRRDRKVCRFCRHAGLFDAQMRAKRSWKAFKEVARRDVQ